MEGTVGRLESFRKVNRLDLADFDHGWFPSLVGEAACRGSSARHPLVIHIIDLQLSQLMFPLGPLVAVIFSVRDRQR